MADHDDSWNLLAKYTAGISQRRGGTSHFSLLDGLGSVRGLLTAWQQIGDSYIDDGPGNLPATGARPVGYARSVSPARSLIPAGVYF